MAWNTVKQRQIWMYTWKFLFCVTEIRDHLGTFFQINKVQQLCIGSLRSITLFTCIFGYIDKAGQSHK